jgi:uncharacterized protein (DUF433 family)
MRKRDEAMSQTITYEHIILDEQGVPVIEGTGMKVVELVLGMLAYGWSAEELQFHSLGQIHSALACYWDHRGELERDIARRLERVERIQREVGPSALVKRLKGKGLLS